MSESGERWLVTGGLECIGATHYGVHKLGSRTRETARVYWADDGVASVGLQHVRRLRACRAQGLMADPTLAMLAAVRGDEYRIGFGGRMQMHYAPGAAGALVDGARAAVEGAVANLGGPPVHAAAAAAVAVAAIEAAAPEAAETITYGAPLPSPEEFEAVGRPAPEAPLEVGVGETMKLFRARA